MKIDIILMAAGNSTRFGENKLLYNFKGKTLFEIALDNIIEGFSNSEHLWSVIVVTQYNEIIDIVSKYKNKKNNNIYAVYSPESVNGVSFTVKNGLKNACGDFYMFAVCDQPFMKSKSYLRLFNETLKSKKSIGTMIFEGQEGNPVVFKNIYRDELLSLSGDRGGRNVLKKHRDEVYFCEAENIEELLDADTVEFFK
ncbi:hypothetical protein B5E58_03505 [Tyzzerella sp. An114]|uniref:nucleotidyltransferase family protein n=1 Tax=Tyzzerella sp. An114 TaxID=1965545 RepID=UPI000B4356FD|nr:nucleotidyltransferase family protein [Tyzzerella sp. An114]OUQ59513.1 hypothetical protein B5E58_03505 [Tyzzerella sp. An114]